jgi:hypothetical protein
MDTCFELWPPYNTIGVPFTWNHGKIYQCIRCVLHDHHFRWYTCNQVTHCCCLLFNMSHVIAIKTAVIRCFRWSRSFVISKYTKVFIWPQKKVQQLQFWCLRNYFCELLLPIQWPGNCWFSHSCTAKILNNRTVLYKWGTVEVIVFFPISEVGHVRTWNIFIV